MQTSNGGHSTQRLIFGSAVSALSGLVVALVVFYVGFGYNAVSKSDLQQQIEQFSPYAQDRATIRRELDDLHVAVHILEARGDDVDKAVARIDGELAAIRRDLDRLIGLHVHNS